MKKDEYIIFLDDLIEYLYRKLEDKKDYKERVCFKIKILELENELIKQKELIKLKQI